MNKKDLVIEELKKKRKKVKEPIDNLHYLYLVNEIMSITIEEKY